MSDPTLAGVNDLFPDVLKRRYKTVTLPMSRQMVRFQSLSEREVSAYQAETIADKTASYKRSKFEDAKRRLIVLCLVDTAGNRILNNSHVQLIADRWDSVDAEFLYDKICEHCGLNRSAIEELVKNSETTTVVD